MPLGFLCIECIKPVISKQFLPLTRLFALHTPTCISGILISHVCVYLIWSCLFIFFWSKQLRKLFCKLSILTVIEYEHSNHEVFVNLDINSPSVDSVVTQITALLLFPVIIFNPFHLPISHESVSDNVMEYHEETDSQLDLKQDSTNKYFLSRDRYLCTYAINSKRTSNQRTSFVPPRTSPITLKWALWP